MQRKIYIKNKGDRSAYDALLKEGVSKGVCVKLRKKAGLVGVSRGGEEVFLRLVDRVFDGETFWYFLDDENETKRIEKYDIPIDIVFEDEDIAVINKPFGLATLPTKNHFGRSLMNALANVWGDFVYRPVNRLDRDTSGLMIVAKNQVAHAKLAKSGVEREYSALVCGHFEGRRIIEEKIGLIGHMKRGVVECGRYAKTEVWEVQKYEGYTLVGAKLYTGRTHQIRVHMAHIGRPLLLDKLYNDQCKESLLTHKGKILTSQALHSRIISFVHPITGESLTFQKESDFF